MLSNKKYNIYESKNSSNRYDVSPYLNFRTNIQFPRVTTGSDSMNSVDASKTKDDLSKNIQNRSKTKYNNIIKKFEEFVDYIQALDSNWDDEGGKPIHEDIISKNESLLKELLRHLAEFNITTDMFEFEPDSDGTIIINFEMRNLDIMINIIGNQIEISKFNKEDSKHNLLIQKTFNDSSIKSITGDIVNWIQEIKTLNIPTMGFATKSKYPTLLNSTGESIRIS
jgi:hypothetical protein